LLGSALRSARAGDPWIRTPTTEAHKESLQEFSKVFNWIRHDHVETWRGPDGAAVEADVTYERTDGREVHVPAVTICRFDQDGLINDYRIFIDLAPLFAD
jgi:hypothetical protein